MRARRPEHPDVGDGRCQERPQVLLVPQEVVGHHDRERALVDRRRPSRRRSGASTWTNPAALGVALGREERRPVVDDDRRSSPSAGRRRTSGIASWPAPQIEQAQRRFQHLDERTDVAGERSGSRSARRRELLAAPRRPPRRRRRRRRAFPRLVAVGPHDDPRPGSHAVARATRGRSRRRSVAPPRGPSAARPRPRPRCSAGSMKTSIAPLQPRPSPQTSSSSAVRSQPASRARPSSITTRAMSATSPSRQPPLMLPIGAPSSGTSRRAPGRR